MRLYELGPFGKSLCTHKLKPESVNTYLEPHVLSACEALYLLKKGLIDIFAANSQRAIPQREVEETLAAAHDRPGVGACLKSLYTVYAYFKEKYFVVQTAAYGGHLLLYEEHPDTCHSRYVVFVMEDTQRGARSWADVTTALRVAQTASKELLLAQVKGEEVIVVKLARFTI